MKLIVDKNEILGNVKPLNGVGQPPMLGINTKYFCYLRDANIPFSRLHDVGGWFGGNMFVDIPNIFRDFSADETDPASYEFTFTDILIKGLVDNGVEPYFRLGVTIENFVEHRSYRLDPPENNEKWARICEHIIRHYNEGWADGFHYNITYWEIWNEPENHPDSKLNPMWSGTPEQYFELYAITSKHLKKCFGDQIKVGGYASCGFMALKFNPEKYGYKGEKQMPKTPAWQERCEFFIDFFLDFFKYIKENNAPLDFFSWHSYEAPRIAVNHEKWVEEKLAEFGYPDVEIHLNEWNPCHHLEDKYTLRASSEILAMICGLAPTKMNIMCYYDARIGTSAYGGLFNPGTYTPVHSYYAMKAYGDLRKLGKICKSELDGAPENVFSIAATNGIETQVIVTNNSNLPVELTSDIKDGKVYKITEILNDEITFETPEKLTLLPYETAIIRMG